MSNVAISVEGLGKRYRIGAGPSEPYGNIRESLVRAAGAPLRRLRGGASGGGATRDAWALKDVSFEVKHGEAVGIIGRNGAGKSTLLKVLSRITEPTTGQAVVHGRVGSLLEVGTGFHPELSGRENIYLNGAVMGMSRADIKRRFDEIVDFAGVETYLDTPVKRYSSGMYMRLAFAVAAHLEPEVLVVDEVLAVGDSEFQKKCLGKMSQVARQGRTVLFVSHNMASILSLCQSGILLQQGHVVHDGDVRDIVSAYFDRTTEPGSFNLANVRAKSGKFAITNIELLSQGLSTTEILVGKDIEIRIDFDALINEPDLSFEFILRDQSGYPLAFCPLGLKYKATYSVAKGRYTFKTRLPNLDLAEGQYFLDLLIAQAGREIYDQYESCIAFSVVASTISTAGWTYKQSRGQGCFHIMADEFDLSPA